MPEVEPRFTAIYHVTVRDGRTVEEHALDIAVEQTVEVPYDCIPRGHIDDGIVGRVERIDLVSEAHSIHEVAVSYRCDVSGCSIPQLLSTLFGNISLKDNIRLVDITLPDSMLTVLPGPRFGVEGVRSALGVYGRPLACTALKPVGLPTGSLASMAESFAGGGIDIIKDDHGIGDQRCSPFRERVARCQEAVERANAKSGGRTLYFPMVSGGFDEIEAQVRYASMHGIRGILIAPMIAGLDTVRHVARQYGLIIMAHPALAGVYFHDRSHGMTPACLLGTLFRLVGVDISVFPNVGGRFRFTKDECLELADALRRPMGGWNAALPCPAGGMPLDRIGEMGGMYGEDTVLLIGGSIMQQYDDLTRGTEAFMGEIRSHFAERLVAPSAGYVASFERPQAIPHGASSGVLKFRGFRWSGREPQDYKVDGDLDFRGIVRHELAGSFGEGTGFDLRYFEIEPGGYSSLEKHVHEHVIIGARGSGLLLAGDEEMAIEPNDVAYVAPLVVHQLRNPGGEPFGFYCIVDHERDRPMKP